MIAPDLVQEAAEVGVRAYRVAVVVDFAEALAQCDPVGVGELTRQGTELIQRVAQGVVGGLERRHGQV